MIELARSEFINEDLQYKMFLLNSNSYILTTTLDTFTIQNVPIKYLVKQDYQVVGLNLQYKMFLLNDPVLFQTSLLLLIYNTKCSY